MSLRISVSALVIALVALAVSPPAAATVVQRVDAAELVDRAALIFRGTAVDSEVAFSGDGLMPSTYVTFEVEEMLKGEAPRRLTVRFEGGMVNDEIWEVEGMPTYEVGGSYLLFLRHTGQGLCPVVGWWQGSLAFERQADESQRLVDAGGRVITGLEDGAWRFDRFAGQGDEEGFRVLSTTEGVTILGARSAREMSRMSPEQVVAGLRDLVEVRRDAATFQPGQRLESIRVGFDGPATDARAEELQIEALQQRREEVVR